MFTARNCDALVGLCTLTLYLHISVSILALLSLSPYAATPQPQRHYFLRYDTTVTAYHVLHHATNTPFFQIQFFFFPWTLQYATLCLERGIVQLSESDSKRGRADPSEVVYFERGDQGDSVHELHKGDSVHKVHKVHT